MCVEVWRSNPRKWDQRFELGSSEAIKSLVIAGLGVGFFSCWEIQQEIAMGLVRKITFLLNWVIRLRFVDSFFLIDLLAANPCQRSSVRQLLSWRRLFFL
jgi:DNA-binding transcriptional LysR family regulator